MSFNQWKLLNQIKDSVGKISSDKSLQNNFKDLSQTLSPGLLYAKLNDIISGKNNETAESDRKPQSPVNLPTVFKGIKKKVRTSKIEDGKIIVPKWKQNYNVSKSCISSQTDYVLQAITTAPTDKMLLNRIEGLIHHIQKYPEARNKAIKMGAIRFLLRIRASNKCEQIQGAAREGLALLGYTDPVPRKGIRILSMDGGGIRGLLVLEMLKKLEELTGQRVHEMFDFFCGVSTGAILSYSMGIHHRDLDEIAQGYEAISKEVFKQSPIWGTSNLVWSHSYYDTSLWEKKLREHLGDDPLIKTARDPKCPKLCAVSAVVNQSRLSAYLFRNYSLPWRFQSQYAGSSDCAVWQAARASAAAPTYFEEYKLGNLLHQDGGILVNNPTAIALHEVKLLWPDTPVQCVVSFGTGRTIPTPSEVNKQPEANSSTSTSWTNKFLTILDSATDTEGVHTMLNDLLPESVYYRFNPYLTEMISMVETDSKKLEQLKRDAVMYLRRNEDKFQEAAKGLMEEKSYTQNVKDFVNIQREILGL